MSEKEEPHTGFMGTYFDRNAVLRLSKTTVVLAWVIFGFYIVQWAYTIWQNVSAAILGGYPVDFSFIYYNSAQPVQGAMLLVIMLIAAKILLILLDIEDNTRRAARNVEKGTK
jgi:hypothetical protein